MATELKLDGNMLNQINVTLAQISQQIESVRSEVRDLKSGLLTNVNGYEHNSLNDRLNELEKATQLMGYALSGGIK